MFDQLMPENLIEYDRGKAWFRCTREGCRVEFSLFRDQIEQLLAKGESMPKYCRSCRYDRMFPERKMLRSPFFRFLPESIQSAVMWRTKKYERGA